MAYGGRCDVTKQVAIYVKEHYYLSNQELDRNIQKLYGCTYADSTYDRIRSGEYDKKFKLNNVSMQQESASMYNRCMQDTDAVEKSNTSHINASQSTDDSDTPNKISGAKIFIAACMGGLGIYGLFHGANPIHNFGGFVIALLLIGGAIACFGGHKK